MLGADVDTQTTRLALARVGGVGALPAVERAAHASHERELVVVFSLDGAHLEHLLGTDARTRAAALAAIAIDDGKVRAPRREAALARGRTEASLKQRSSARVRESKVAWSAIVAGSNTTMSA